MCAARSGYVRNSGLSVNQLVHIPGAGDFQLDRIEGVPEPQPAVGSAQHRQHGAAAQMDAAQLLAAADPAAREPLQREHEADALAGEQTWPTDQVSSPLQAAHLPLPSEHELLAIYTESDTKMLGRSTR